MESVIFVTLDARREVRKNEEQEERGEEIAKGFLVATSVGKKKKKKKKRKRKKEKKKKKKEKEKKIFVPTPPLPSRCTLEYLPCSSPLLPSSLLRVAMPLPPLLLSCGFIYPALDEQKPGP